MLEKTLFLYFLCRLDTLLIKKINTLFKETKMSVTIQLARDLEKIFVTDLVVIFSHVIKDHTSLIIFIVTTLLGSLTLWILTILGFKK